MEDNVCKICRLISYVICIALFFGSSIKIFQAFYSDITIISTQVIPPPGGVLESPTFLICNDSPFKERVLNTNPDDYKNNTMALKDVLLDVLFVKGGEGILNYKPVSIKESVKEVATMFHGTCFMIDKTLKVN